MRIIHKKKRLIKFKNKYNFNYLFQIIKLFNQKKFKIS